jgi:hypothetical protein
VLLQSTQELLALLEVSATQDIGGLAETRAPPLSAPPPLDVDAAAQQLFEQLVAVDLGMLASTMAALPLPDQLWIDAATLEVRTPFPVPPFPPCSRATRSRRAPGPATRAGRPRRAGSSRSGTNTVGRSS